MSQNQIKPSRVRKIISQQEMVYRKALQQDKPFSVLKEIKESIKKLKSQLPAEK